MWQIAARDAGLILPFLESVSAEPQVQAAPRMGSPPPHQLSASSRFSRVPTGLPTGLRYGFLPRSVDTEVS